MISQFGATNLKGGDTNQLFWAFPQKLHEIEKKGWTERVFSRPLLLAIECRWTFLKFFFYINSAIFQKKLYDIIHYYIHECRTSKWNGLFTCSE